MAKTKKSKSGFWFTRGFDPMIFEKEKFQNDERPKIQDFLRKINNGKIKLCEILWNKNGPADGRNWMFTCSDDECKRRGGYCGITIVYNNNANPNIREIPGDNSTGESGPVGVVGPPADFIRDVLLVYCECKKSKR